VNFWKTQSFKALQDEWYQRLEKEGFRDVEITIGDEPVLKQTAAHPYRGAKQLEIDCQEAYYWLLLQKAESAEFSSEIDRIILTSFARGVKIYMICEDLRRRGMSRDRKAVRFTIRRYEMLWGMREYTNAQVGSGRGGRPGYLPKRKWERRAK
jgi:hypothetical protein